MLNYYLNNKVNRLFLLLGGFFVANALIAEIIGTKIFSLEKTLGFNPFSMNLFGIDGLGFNLTAGVLLWPVVFIMTDIINEYFGARGVRILSFGTVGLIIYAFIIIYLAIHLSPNDWWKSESGMLSTDPAWQLSDMDLAFRKILGQGLWIIVGSLVAFLIGQFVDVFSFHKIKNITGEKKIWLRATGSTLVSQFIDSFVVLIVAFYIGANWELSRVLAIGVVNYMYKFVIAIVLTPMIYLAHHWIDNYLGEELATKLKEDAKNSAS